MSGNDGRPAVLVANEVMTALHSDDLEPGFGECRNQLWSGEAGEAGPDASRTRCTPTKSSVSVVSPSTSRQSAIASFRLSRSGVWVHLAGMRVPADPESVGHVSPRAGFWVLES